MIPASYLTFPRLGLYGSAYGAFVLGTLPSFGSPAAFGEKNGLG